MLAIYKYVKVRCGPGPLANKEDTNIKHNQTQAGKKVQPQASIGYRPQVIFVADHKVKRDSLFPVDKVSFIRERATTWC